MKQKIINILEFIEYKKRLWVNPVKYLPKIFKRRVGYDLNLENPLTFNEKLQWLKLYNHDPLYTILVDKFAVKDYVKKIIGEKYIIPTLGVWESFDDIDFSKLPNQFVLKCTHDSGGLVICKDKASLDIKAAKKKIQKSLRFNYYYMGFEWPYKNVRPRIIAEKYMEDSETQELRDYKFFVFQEQVKALFIVTNRNSKEKKIGFDFFDENFHHLPFTRGHDNAIEMPHKPATFEKMKFLAKKLSKDIPFVRVDFYDVNGQIYFGEMTFFPGGGWEPFIPQEWDYKFGSWLNLPSKRYE